MQWHKIIGGALVPIASSHLLHIINKAIYSSTMGNLCQNPQSSNSGHVQPELVDIKVAQSRPQQDLIKKLATIRSEAISLPLTNNHVEQKIKKLTKFGQSANKMWKLKSPYNIVYANRDAHLQNDLPKGYVKVYKAKENGDFLGYFQGKITQNFQPDFKQCFFVFHNASYLVGTGQNKGVYTNQVTNLKYEGGWLNQQPHGMGKEHNNKGVYEGMYLLGQKHGLGKFVWNDGPSYQGSFIRGTLQGKGLFINPVLKYSYEGEFSADLKHGKGVENKAKQTYTGQFYAGKRCGKGKLVVYEDQNHTNIKFTYQGTFYDNQPHGQGIYNDKKSNRSVNGIWTKGSLITICA